MICLLNRIPCRRLWPCPCHLLPATCRYSVPRLHLPAKAIAAAKAAGKTPDTFYCLQARPSPPACLPFAACLPASVW